MQDVQHTAFLCSQYVPGDAMILALRCLLRGHVSPLINIAEKTFTHCFMSDQVTRGSQSCVCVWVKVGSEVVTLITKRQHTRWVKSAWEQKRVALCFSPLKDRTWAHFILSCIFIIRPITNINRLFEGTESVEPNTVLPFCHLCNVSVWHWRELSKTESVFIHYRCLKTASRKHIKPRIEATVSLKSSHQ